MATRVDLPKEIVKNALEQAASLRARNQKTAFNTVIKEALEQEERAIRVAIGTLDNIK